MPILFGIYIDHLRAIVFFFIYYSFRDNGQKLKVGHFRGNNSFKGSPYNFIQMKTFDELDLLIISASKSFSGSQEEDQNVKKLTDERTDDERNVMAKVHPDF